MTHTQEIKHAIRQQYVWPGGYPLYLVTSDGAALCCACGRKEWRQICRSMHTEAQDGWNVRSAVVNWEDTELFCDHCNTQIESAYGEQ